MVASRMVLLMAVCAFAGRSYGQIRVTATEELPLGVAHAWALPQWAPDGQSIYYTESSFNGIWKYSLVDHAITNITNDPASGYGFRLSADGTRIAFRRTLTGPGELLRVQESVVRDLVSGTETLLARGSDVAIDRMGGEPASALGSNAETVINPTGDGRNIWIDLSPAGDRIVAYHMEKGTIVCNADGTGQVFLGKRDGAVWSRDGRWLIYMQDVDDGHQLVQSELAFVSPDGAMSGTLTSTTGVTELFPRCSMTENKIVCATAEGKIVVLTYEVTP
jgi:hypothetical protein